MNNKKDDAFYLKNGESKGDIVIYQSEDGETRIDVRFSDETVWLTQAQMEELFQSSHANIVEHIKNIYAEGELEEESTCRKFRQVRQEGNRNVTREVLCYNLDMIISLGYRRINPNIFLNITANKKSDTPSRKPRGGVSD